MADFVSKYTREEVEALLDSIFGVAPIDFSNDFNDDFTD